MTLKKTGFLLATACIFQFSIYAQEIVNVVLVGKNGITENIKEAQSFVMVKKYPGNMYERLDYKMNAPLTKMRTYNDSLLSILHGAYLEYYPNGECHIKGEYKNNFRDNNWLYYKTDGKLDYTETYKEGNLEKTVREDTVKPVKDTVHYADEREANMEGGIKTWIAYLQQNLKADLAQQTKRGGSVRVYFKIDINGALVDIHMKKSVEYILDEEAVRVIRASPRWIPAFQNGKPVNAYRIQPLTFTKE